MLGSREKKEAQNLRNVDRAGVRKETTKVNTILKYIPVGNITEIRNVVQAASALVCEQLGVKERKKREEKEPYWKRRIEGDVKRLRRENTG